MWVMGLVAYCGAIAAVWWCVDNVVLAVWVGWALLSLVIRWAYPNRGAKKLGGIL